ncbi:MAG: DUF1329 domain-containing protein [Rhodocyclaceae bacterium]|nr:DUF1329 domain-containing protein [Rhodocyclaceae bacterium]
MWYSKALVAVAFGAVGLHGAMAAPTPEEAAQLGKSLTPFGAIKAGNKDGSIPEWTGGVCTPPAGYKPARGLEAGGAPYVDPFATDKPLLKVTAADVDKYGDRLDEGTKELLRLHAKTFYLNVYPSRRSACFPDWVYENTVKRVMKPALVGGDVPSLTGAHAQVPFPIPKSGAEAMWNTVVKVEPRDTSFEFTKWLVDGWGNRIGISQELIANQNLYWDNSLKEVPEDRPYWTLISKATAPASQSGTMQMRHQFLRADQKGAPAWSYLPGQRRVRLAPEFSYDRVGIAAGGILLYDEINGFDGKMDRFDFKLLGRRDMLVPYNTYAYWQSGADVIKPGHVEPSVLRFELHRTWVVEATLKAGARHLQKKKVFFIDEDSWNILVYYSIDQSDRVHHVMYLLPIQAYDKPEIRNTSYILYDFVKGAYLASNKFGDEGLAGVPAAPYKTRPYPASYFTAESMAGMGVR